MRPKVRKFLSGYYRPGSLLEATQSFLRHQLNRGVSHPQITHLYYSLYPLGVELDNPHIKEIDAYKLREYQDGLWLRYAPATIRSATGDILHFFRWAKKKGLVEKNPAKRVKKPKKRPGRSRIVEEEMILAMVKNLRERLKRVCYRDLFGNLQNGQDGWHFEEVKAVRDLFIFLFLYETGARVGELCSLSTRAMDESLLRSAGVAYEVVSIGKTGDKPLRFTRVTAEVYRIWRSVRPDSSLHAVTSWGRGDSFTRPMSPDTVAKVFERRCRQAAVGVFRPHTLRHAKARRARKAVGLDMAKELMGHSTILVTQEYAEVINKELTDAAMLTGWNLGDFWR